MQNRQINKAYLHYTEMMTILGSQNIMPKEVFFKMIQIMFQDKDQNNSNKNFDQIKEWHKTKHNNVEDFKPKRPRPNNNIKEDSGGENKPSKSPQRQINEALDKIVFLQAEINKYKGDTEMTKSLEGALINQKNKINNITNNGKQIKGLFDNQYYINHVDSK